jgi:chromosome partitioning protein
VTVTAVCAFKGGVGKTTVTANVAAAWAARGTGAVIDLDPQGNLTRAFGIRPADRGQSTSADLLRAASTDAKRRIGPEDWSIAYVNGAQPLLVLEAGDPQVLNDIQDLLVTARGGETALRRLLTDVRAELDWILIDTPPASGRLTMNAVLAADSVFAVVNPAYWSADGASRVSAYVEDLVEFIPSDTRFRGAILNRVPGGSRAVVTENMSTLKAAGVKLLATHIPERTAVQMGETLSEPIVSADPSSDAAKTLAGLADEMWALAAGKRYTPRTTAKKPSKGKGKR